MRSLVVGMGLMGSALADALLRKNMTVSVWNRTEERCQPAIDAGATRVASIAEGARECDVVISCLADHQAVLDTVITPDVGQLLTGKTFVQLSQATSEQSLEFAAWASHHGIGYLDGSILGYPKDVRTGDCVIIYSGNTAVFEACHAVLRALGSKPRLVGDRPRRGNRLRQGLLCILLLACAGSSARRRNLPCSRRPSRLVSGSYGRQLGLEPSGQRHCSGAEIW